MKALFALILAYCAVTLYFVALNATSFSFVPMVYIVLLLVYYYADFRFALYAAGFAGYFMDIHFQYIGPYICIFVSSMLLMNWMQGIISSRHNLASTLTLYAVVSAWYALSLFFVFSLLNGFQYYYHGVQTVWLLSFLALIAWGVPVTVIALQRVFSSLYRHARR
jgi:hypothetical protein